MPLLYIRVARMAISQLLSDAWGVLAHPRSTMQEILHHRGWGGPLLMLLLIVLLGAPGVYIGGERGTFVRYESRTTELGPLGPDDVIRQVDGQLYVNGEPIAPRRVTNTQRRVAFSQAGLMAIVFIASMFALAALEARNVPWRRFFRLIGYIVIPQVAWVLILLAVLLTLLGLGVLELQRTSGFHWQAVAGETSLPWVVSAASVIALILLTVAVLIYTIRLSLLVLEMAFPALSGIKRLVMIILAMLITNLWLNVPALFGWA